MQPGGPLFSAAFRRRVHRWRVLQAEGSSSVSGHIRVYAAFCRHGRCRAMRHAAWFFEPVRVPWILLRANHRFGCAAFFVTTEIWLNSKAGPCRARIRRLLLL